MYKMGNLILEELKEQKALLEDMKTLLNDIKDNTSSG
jgi:hypothetical protein|tara:strand:- start:4766 stop:4876 length:111 start_codon:yes stop_codon:yes gene_type:complete